MLSTNAMLQLRVGFLIVILTGVASSTSAEVVQGTVVEDHSGAPLPSASVRLKMKSGVVVKEVDTDRSGRFAMSGLIAGEYQLEVTKASYIAVNAKLTAQPDATAVDPAAALPVLRLIRYGVISGHATSPRGSGAVIAIEQVSEGQIPRSYTAMFNSSGDFRIFGIQPGRYQLVMPFVGNNNGQGTSRGLAVYPNITRPREFVISGGEQFDGIQFAAPAGSMSSISGKVIAPGGPQRYTMTIVAPEYPTIRMMTAPSEQDGSFRFDNIFPGSYDMYVSGPVNPPGYFARLRLELPSQNFENIEVRLQPGRSIEFVLSAGKATTSNPVCSADGVITLQGLGSWPLVRDQMFTIPIAPQAPVRIDNAGPSKFAVTARSSKGDCVGIVSIIDLTQDAFPQRTVVSFQPPSSIHGTVTTGNYVVLRDMTPGRESPVQAFFPGASFEFHFDRLAAGQYCVNTLSVTDPISHWSPESGCAGPIIYLSAGESKEL